MRRRTPGAWRPLECSEGGIRAFCFLIWGAGCPLLGLGIQNVTQVCVNTWKSTHVDVNVGFWTRLRKVSKPKDDVENLEPTWLNILLLASLCLLRTHTVYEDRGTWLPCGRDRVTPVHNFRARCLYLTRGPFSTPSSCFKNWCSCMNGD